MKLTQETPNNSDKQKWELLSDGSDGSRAVIRNKASGRYIGSNSSSIFSILLDLRYFGSYNQSKFMPYNKDFLRLPSSEGFKPKNGKKYYLESGLDPSLVVTADKDGKKFSLQPKSASNSRQVFKIKSKLGHKGYSIINTGTNKAIHYNSGAITQGTDSATTWEFCKAFSSPKANDYVMIKYPYDDKLYLRVYASAGDPFLGIASSSPASIDYLFKLVEYSSSSAKASAIDSELDFDGEPEIKIEEAQAEVENENASESATEDESMGEDVILNPELSDEELAALIANANAKSEDDKSGGCDAGFGVLALAGVMILVKGRAKARR